jgi:hypothetical protein
MMAFKRETQTPAVALLVVLVVLLFKLSGQVFERDHSFSNFNDTIHDTLSRSTFEIDFMIARTVLSQWFGYALVGIQSILYSPAIITSTALIIGNITTL